MEERILQNYKSLEDLGVPKEECYTNWFDEVNPCDREAMWKEQRDTYGIDERSTWNWSDDFMDYMYIHLEMFNRVNIVDFNHECEVIEFNKEKITIQTAIDIILSWMKERYYPKKLDTISIDDYENSDEGRTQWKEDMVKWLGEKHRVVQLFAEIIEHLNW